MAVNRKDYTEQGIIVLTPTDELLTANVIHEIQAIIDSTAAKHVLIDFEGIQSLVSGSLYPHAEPIKPLLALSQRLQHEARRLVLCNLGSEFAEVFRLTHLDQMFEVQPDLDSALSNATGEIVE
jgi:anti-anti-sigma regulatory factor